MANILLPAGGKRKDTEKLEFSFHAVRKVRDVGCVGYSCENIPEHLYDFKWTDYQLQDQLCPQRQEQQQNTMSQLRSEHRFPQIDAHLSNTSQCSTCQNGVESPAIMRGSSVVSAAPFQHTNGTRDMKRPTVPMPNCRHLHCRGKRRHCRLPDDGLWGYSNSEVTNCAWNKEQHTHKRLPDPQVVRPRDKNADKSARPSGQPYFTHERMECACVPAHAPKAIPTGFDYQQWLATRQDREPPAGIQNKCIASLCNLCGPRTVECCQGHADPYHYLLAKKI